MSFLKNEKKELQIDDVQKCSYIWEFTFSGFFPNFCIVISTSSIQLFLSVIALINGSYFPYHNLVVIMQYSIHISSKASHILTECQWCRRSKHLSWYSSLLSFVTIVHTHSYNHLCFVNKQYPKSHVTQRLNSWTDSVRNIQHVKTWPIWDLIFHFCKHFIEYNIHF